MKVKYLKEILKFMDDDTEITDYTLKGFRDTGNWCKFKSWRCSLGLTHKAFNEKFETTLRVCDFERGISYMDKELYLKLKDAFGDVVDELVEPCSYKVKQQEEQ